MKHLVYDVDPPPPQIESLKIGFAFAVLFLFICHLQPKHPNMFVLIRFSYLILITKTKRRKYFQKIVNNVSTRTL